VHRCGDLTLSAVSRLTARSANFDMHLSLDVNFELYPLRPHEKFTLALSTSLARGGAGEGTDAEEGDQGIWRPDGKGRRGLEEDYEYVMYGKVYKFDEGTGEIVTAYASFGGLLMALTGSYRHMQGIILGDPVYLLMRR